MNNLSSVNSTSCSSNHYYTARHNITLEHSLSPPGVFGLHTYTPCTGASYSWTHYSATSASNSNNLHCRLCGKPTARCNMTLFIGIDPLENFRLHQKLRPALQRPQIKNIDRLADSEPCLCILSTRRLKMREWK